MSSLFKLCLDFQQAVFHVRAASPPQQKFDRAPDGRDCGLRRRLRVIQQFFQPVDRLSSERAQASDYLADDGRLGRGELAAKLRPAESVENG
jgi:hypothetical protein